MLIRPATAADAGAIVDLIQCLADFEKLEGPSAGAKARLLRDALDPACPLILWVAELDGEVRAYAAWFYTYSTFLARKTLYLEDLFVHPEVRRRGVGKAMMEALRAEAEAGDCGRFEWSVLGWNEDAQRFYETLGATAESDWQMMRITLPSAGADPVS